MTHDILPIALIVAETASLACSSEDLLTVLELSCYDASTLLQASFFPSAAGHKPFAPLLRLFRLRICRESDHCLGLV
jgi:hypothetical protein